MVIGIICSTLGIISFYFSRYFWKKGNPEEHFMEALVDSIFSVLNIFSWQLPLYWSFRNWSITFWFAGVLLILYGIPLIILNSPS